MRALHAVFLGLGLVVWIPAQAGRPMATDDAGITEAGACQLESWAQRSQGLNEYWMVPACNFTGNLEVAVGRTRIDTGFGHDSTTLVQGKTLFKPLATNSWGIGVAAGVRFRKEYVGSGDKYAYIPLSWSFADDRLLVHSNIGWLRDGVTRRDAVTWALGAETALARRTSISAEAFGQHKGKPSWQIGARHWLIADRVQVDLTYGSRFGQLGGEGRWFSLGLKFVTAPIW